MRQLGELQRGCAGVVAHRVAQLDGLSVHERLTAGQGNSAHAARGRREDAQTRRVIDDIGSRGLEDT